LAWFVKEKKMDIYTKFLAELSFREKKEPPQMLLGEERKDDIAHRTP
jgi:hypothetical protein